jgi:hypothetical protein
MVVMKERFFSGITKRCWCWCWFARSLFWLAEEGVQQDCGTASLLISAKMLKNISPVVEFRRDDDNFARVCIFAENLFIMAKIRPRGDLALIGMRDCHPAVCSYVLFKTQDSRLIAKHSIERLPKLNHYDLVQLVMTPALLLNDPQTPSVSIWILCFGTVSR